MVCRERWTDNGSPTVLLRRRGMARRGGKNQVTALGGMPTLNGYNTKAVALQDEIIRVSREDLGIEPKHRWYKFW